MIRGKSSVFCSRLVSFDFTCRGRKNRTSTQPAADALLYIHSFVDCSFSSDVLNHNFEDLLQENCEFLTCSVCQHGGGGAYEPYCYQPLGVGVCELTCGSFVGGGVFV